MKIPALDLKRQYALIQQEVGASLDQLFSSQSFILGESVAAFEQNLAAYCGVPHAVGVSSGTDAIQLALMALDIGPGDEVITTPFTFVATAEPVALLGAVPVFADIDPDTFNLNPECIAAKITSKTKAIIVVHLYGQVADMDAILALARTRGLAVIEDTAQAMGATYGASSAEAGTLGDLGTLSFFPSKNLGAFGDGGAVLTSQDHLAARLRRLRVHGSDQRYYHDEIGINGRLDALQAAILNVKLKHLPKWLKERNLRGRIYDELIDLRGLREHVSPPHVAKHNFHTYHQYVVKVASTQRDAVVDFLQASGIESRVYYPVPLHLQKCFSYLGYEAGDFPVSEACAQQILALPLFPELTQDEQEYVINKLEEFFEK